MRIISLKALAQFGHANPKCADEIRAWIRVTRNAKWTNTNEVKEYYPKASILKKGRVIFGLSRSVRLIVHIHYKSGIVFVRFIGHHSEYDKIDPNII